jgi:hypothetical protein
MRRNWCIYYRWRRDWFLISAWSSWHALTSPGDPKRAWHLPSSNVRSSPFSFLFIPPFQSFTFTLLHYKTAAYLVATSLIPSPQVKPHAAFKLYPKLTTFFDPKHPSAPNTLSIGVKGSSCAASGVLRYPHRKSCWQGTCRDKSKTTKQLAL